MDVGGEECGRGMVGRGRVKRVREEENEVDEESEWEETGCAGRGGVRSGEVLGMKEIR